MKGFTIAGVMLALCSAPAVPELVAQDTGLIGQDSQATTGAQNPKAPGAVKPEIVQPVKPMSLPMIVDPHTYTLGADDVISVRVWREPDLSGTMAVRPDGMITMPLVNEVKAAGKTPELLAEEIGKQLSKFVNSPQVIVSVESVRSKRYYVTGEVNRPGAYPLASPITVFDALTMAGGFREFANKKKVTIIRGTQRLKFNWNDIIKGKNLSQNVPLENGDRIVVP